MERGEARKQTVAPTSPLDRTDSLEDSQDTLSPPLCMRLHAVGQRGEGTGAHRPW